MAQSHTDESEGLNHNTLTVEQLDTDVPRYKAVRILAKLFHSVESEDVENYLAIEPDRLPTYEVGR